MFRFLSTARARLYAACAASMLATAMLASPGACAATLERAAALLQTGDLTAADHEIAAVLAAQPDSAPAHYLDARLLAAEGKWPLAAGELARARQLDPALAFAPAAELQDLSDAVAGHQRQRPLGLAGYGKAALALLFLAVSGYLALGMVRARRAPPSR